MAQKLKESITKYFCAIANLIALAWIEKNVSVVKTAFYSLPPRFENLECNAKGGGWYVRYQRFLWLQFKRCKFLMTVPNGTFLAKSKALEALFDSIKCECK